MNKRVVIFGGSGFVGQSIAKQLAAADYQVISISRSGKPKQVEPWMEQVKWVRADVFTPTDWQEHVKSGDVLIDAIGLLVENKAKQLTYQRYHYELVKLMVTSLGSSQPDLFIYVSAAHGLPFHQGYLYWKKQAEAFLEKQSFPVAFIKPSLLYGEGRKYSRAMARMILFSKKLPIIQQALALIKPQPVEKVGVAVQQAIKQSLKGDRYES